jgi:serine phosphatase RsbU (regulator of sigma subunit)/HAMP domain-containing protein
MRLNSLKSKLILSFTLSLAVVTLIVVTFIWFDHSTQELAEINVNLTEIELETKEVSILEKDFFSYDVIEENFYRDGTSRLLEVRKERIVQLKESLSKLGGNEELDVIHIKQDVSQLLEKIEHFDIMFYLLIDELLRRGFKDYGLEGQMRYNIHILENAPELTEKGKIYVVRKHEKDYFLRKELKYITLAEEAIKDLKVEINSKVKNKIQREAYLEHADNYINYLLQIVDIEERIGVQTQGGLKSEILSFWHTIEDDLNQIESAVLEEVSKIRTEVELTIGGLLLVFILFLGFLLHLLIQQLGRPIRRLSQSINNIITNNFEEGKVDAPNSKDEIGQLGRDIKLMVEKVRHNTSQISSQNKKIEMAFKNLEVISQKGREITSSLELEEIINVTESSVKELIACDLVAIGLYNSETYTLDFVFQFEQEPAVIRDSIDDKTRIPVVCFKTGQIISLGDVSAEYKRILPNATWKLTKQKEPKSVIYIPLTAKKETMGVITVQSFKKNAFADYHLNILQAISIYLSIALENASIFNEIEKKNAQLQASEEELKMNAEELRSVNEQLESSNRLMQIRNEQLTQQKLLIEKKNADIQASINYAQRIQEAVLPEMDLILEKLPESFVFFKPRDIVSGDFFWFNTLKNKTILIAADCTGHGVPGAFMSLIGNNLLNQIVLQNEITSPDQILNQLHVKVRQVLKQEETLNRDGMDMAVVVLEELEDKIMLHFSGAKSNLYLAKSSDLEVVKGDINSIGGEQKEETRVFSLYSFEVAEPMTFYLSSDGFHHQFGGPEGKKFMLKAFRELLFSIKDLPANQQLAVVEKTYSDWKGEEAQLDDILVIGAKIKPLLS